MKVMNGYEMRTVLGGGNDTTTPYWGVNAKNRFGPAHYRLIHESDDYVVYYFWGGGYVEDI